MKHFKLRNLQKECKWSYFSKIILIYTLRNKYGMLAVKVYGYSEIRFNEIMYNFVTAYKGLIKKYCVSA